MSKKISLKEYRKIAIALGAPVIILKKETFYEEGKIKKYYRPKIDRYEFFGSCGRGWDHAHKVAKELGWTSLRDYQHIKIETSDEELNKAGFKLTEWDIGWQFSNPVIVWVK